MAEAFKRFLNGPTGPKTGDLEAGSAYRSQHKARIAAKSICPPTHFPRTSRSCSSFLGSCCQLGFGHRSEFVIARLKSNALADSAQPTPSLRTLSPASSLQALLDMNKPPEMISGPMTGGTLAGWDRVIEAQRLSTSPSRNPNAAFHTLSCSPLRVQSAVHALCMDGDAAQLLAAGVPCNQRVRTDVPAVSIGPVRAGQG